MYSESLNRDKMTLPQKRAYKSWIDQRQRCNNPNNTRYYCYGSKGIKVEYSSRELIGWYEEEYKKRDSWKRPQVSRINHERNYSLDNVELVECSENVKERNLRLGNPQKSKKIIAINLNTNEYKLFESKRLAARELNVSRKCIKNQLDVGLKRNPLKEWVFKYY